MDKENIHLPQDADTYSIGAGLSVYAKSDIKNLITINNNKAHYFANQAKKFRDEAKVHCENAKNYAESNSNVTYDQLIDLRTVLETEINKKQEIGDYALKKELPQNVSELENDLSYTTQDEVTSLVDEVRLPDLSGNADKFLFTDGKELSWEKIPREMMFSTKLLDHILTYEESKGWALQGTYVYKDAVAGSRYGYPDFYAKCLEEYNEATNTETVNDVVIKVHSNGHKFFDIADKASIEEFYNIYGTAWFYGIDTENERVLLPRNNYFEQATGIASEVGDNVKAGLPNIIGMGSATWSASLELNGALYALSSSSTGGAYSKTAASGTREGFDASLSNSIYGNSDTVQPNAVKKLLYICVGNTTSESVITDVVDVTTTENDTVPLFTGQYFDFKPNNLCWLKAGEQANSGSIYATCYNELINELTNPKYGLKVIETSAMQSDVDYSEYWKVNQDKMYFICPTAMSIKFYNDTAPVVGNGYSLGLMGYSKTYGDNVFTNLYESDTGSGVLSEYYLSSGEPQLVGGTVSGGTGGAYNNSTYVGVTTDSTKSGIEAHLVENTTAQLYFKVANAVENLELLDVGEVMTSLANKVDINSKIIDGQWVYSPITLTTSTSTAQTLDLSTYLPNDNYNYEVLFVTRLYRDGDCNLDISTDLFGNSPFKISFVNTNARQAWQQVILPVGIGRFLTTTTSTTAGTMQVGAWGYRRLGTNE